MKKKQEFKGYLKSISEPIELGQGKSKVNILITVKEFDNFGEPKGESGYLMSLFIPNKLIDLDKLKELVGKRVKGVCFLNPFEYDLKSGGKTWGLGLNLYSIELWT
jgi:hypothetical protein